MVCAWVWVLGVVWDMWTCGHGLRLCRGCWCGVGCWVLVFGCVVVGVDVGVWVKWSPMAVASRLMGFNGVGCGCGHCPMLGGVVVGVVRCGNVGRTSLIATGMGRPLMAWDRGWGCGAWGIEWCKHSISEKKKNEKTLKVEKEKTKNEKINFKAF